jgi:hypothetical protein
MKTVMPSNMCGHKPLHELRNIGPHLGNDDEMKVVRHDRERKDGEAHTLQRIRERGEKPLVVDGLREDFVAAISAIEYVVRSTVKKESLPSWHTA